jgi:hypothetical protein
MVGDFSYLVTTKPLMAFKLLFMKLINKIQGKGVLNTKHL